jgi:hypothetical protein
VAARPKDAAAPRASKKGFVVDENEIRHLSFRLGFFQGRQSLVAYQTTPKATLAGPEAKGFEHLRQLLLPMVALYQEHLEIPTLRRKVTVPSENHPPFLPGHLEEAVDMGSRKIARIIAQDPQPFSQSAQHGIGQKLHD